MFSQPPGASPAQGPVAPQVVRCLQAGLAAQKAGRLAEAEQQYRRVLAADPRNPDALQLLGLLAKTVGDLPAAEDFMRRSLAARPDQPNVLSNLGNLLLGLGRSDEALAAYGRALSLKPDYAEAWFNQARALQELGRIEEAVDSVRAALRINPTYVPALTNLGVLLTGQGKLGEAEQVYRRATALAPTSAKLHQNLGKVLKELGRFDEAEAALREAIRIDPDLKEAWHNLGNVLATTRRHDGAIEAYRRVVALDPFNRDAHANLNQELWRTGRHDELLRSYEDLCRAFPDHADAWEMAAYAGMLHQRTAQAWEDIQRARSLAPASPTALGTAARILLQMDRPAESEALLAEALEVAPDTPPLMQGLVIARMRQGRAGETLPLIDRLLAGRPDNQFNLALLGTAWRLLGDGRAAWLNDYDRCTAVADLAPPPGYPDLPAFHASLMRELERLHTTRHEPVDQTLRNGTQTSETLFGPGMARVTRDLHDTIRAAVARFIAGLDGDPGHPFTRRKAADFRFTGSWSVRLRDRGFHTHHVHTDGWISGVYYVEVPRACAAADDRQGWLVFGVPGIGDGIDLGPERAIQPQPGRLVLFPSYVWHGTVPFCGPETRTTVAFDIVPA